MSSRVDFYRKVLSEFIQDKEAAILVCGGGELDCSVLSSEGYRNVTVTNIEKPRVEETYPGFVLRAENGENLSFPDDSFDYAVVHAAVHHASSPHRFLTEMYRVSRMGMLVVESRDSMTIRLLQRLGLVQTYEHAAIQWVGSGQGGVNNTEIPNYVYRWTEREVEKTLSSYAPHVRHRIVFRYGSDQPRAVAKERGSGVKLILLSILGPWYWLMTRLLPSQQNLFAVFAEKPNIPRDLHPWLYADETGAVRFNQSWGERRYSAPGDSRTTQP